MVQQLANHSTVLYHLEIRLGFANDSFALQESSGETQVCVTITQGAVEAEVTVVVTIKPGTAGKYMDENEWLKNLLSGVLHIYIVYMQNLYAFILDV